MFGLRRGSVPILCNNKQLLVAPSLHEVLVRFAYDHDDNRRATFLSTLPSNGSIDEATLPDNTNIWTLLTTPSMWLWVDQVCINQKDEVAKSCQIPLIKHIYKCALTTILWMGVQTLESKTTLCAAQVFFDAFRRYVAAGDTLKLIPVTPREILDLDLAMPSDSDREQVAAFLRQGWFSRL